MRLFSYGLVDSESLNQHQICRVHLVDVCSFVRIPRECSQIMSQAGLKCHKSIWTSQILERAM